MTDEEYQALLSRVYSGKVLIGIDRTLARQLYTDVPVSRIKEKTGEAPYFQRTIVLGAQICGQLALLASLVFAFLAFSWWAALVIPVSIVVYFNFLARSAMAGGGGMAGVSVLVGLSLLGSYLGWFPSQYASWFAVLLTAALWNARLIYDAADHFMRAFVFRNRRAYEFLAEHIHIREAQ